MDASTSEATAPTLAKVKVPIDKKKHILETLRPTKNKKYPTRACLVCKANGGRSETRYVCRLCEVPLHKGNCFTEYHNKKQS